MRARRRGRGASVLGGGFAPFVATALLGFAGGAFWPVAVDIGVLALISLVTVLLAAETKGVSLTDREVAFR